MKKLILVASMLLGLAACQQQATDHRSGDTAAEHAIKHLDPKYVCPMHPQIIRDQPGSCPICGMDLVEKAVSSEPETAAEHAIKHLDPKYVCPMHPQIVRDQPGSCPICGMDLVQKAVESATGDEAVTISPAVVQNLGVRTAVAERGRLWRMIDTVGYIDVDESRVSHMHLRTDGWIEKMYVRSEGERVKRGDPLVELYSPKLVNAQEEYLEAMKSGNKTLIQASRDRLRALDVSDEQIDQVGKRGRASQTITFHADRDGIVTRLKTPEGMYVQPATELMSLVDLSSVWVQVEVFEHQSDWVETGQAAEMELSFHPGRTWEGEIAYIYPELDERTRTLRVRLQFDNPDERLKPKMYANVRLYAGARNDILYIPVEAVINSGRQTRVILAEGDGRFSQRRVTTGLQSGDYVEVIDGLIPGDKVVTSGQFLIDSEASLKASLKRMTSTEPGQ